ncbi:hypothetical protein [Chitinophaga barathri]|uniref:DUF4595 domain-containing protein n=1 Tax=Chitinophaga barathri TaxID=1647451 RepID=A0A3N4M708_9BACT|nr:hypothetical protein [Chitinophaga barathri]RPD39091.1 hypothetical protein EG028_20955 [Chitinophaga barathri]
MKWINPIKLLLLPVVLFALASCKKYPSPGWHCPPVPQCPVASIVKTNESLPFCYVQRNYMNVPVKLEYYERSVAGAIYEGVLDVHYQGRKLYLTDVVTQDTVLAVKLDECGRPVQSFFAETMHLPGVPVSSRYFYNAQGRLSRYESIEGDLGSAQNFSYDQRGNLLKISAAGDLAFEYTYDYARPVEKGTVTYAEVRERRMNPLTMLEYLGHIDLMPRNLRLTSRSWIGDYQTASFAYSNHVFSGQRLVSYEGDGTFALTWSCQKTPPRK